MNVYPFIEVENAGSHGNVKRVCGLLEVSRAAYYAHRAGKLSQRTREDAALLGAIKTICDEAKSTDGAPRVHAECGCDRLAVFA